MFGKKKSANFCRAHRLWIGYQYHRAHQGEFESHTYSDFYDWFRGEYGTGIHGAFLNEILEEFFEYEKNHPNGEGIFEMLRKIPSDLMGEQGPELNKTKLELLNKIDLQRKNWKEEYYRKMRAENGTTGSDFHISW